MALTNLTDRELQEFLQDPNAFLSKPENLTRALGLTPSAIASIRENLEAQGLSEAQVEERLSKVASIKEIIKIIIGVMRPESVLRFRFDRPDTPR